MPVGVILAFAAYAIFSVSDALIKATGPAMSVFEIAFFTTSFSIIPLMLTKRGERFRDMYKLHHPWLVHLRCTTAILGTACVMYAFTHIAFADVYAIGFTTPVIVTVLSVFFLRETVTPQRWLLLLLCFLGVVLVIRPGMRELEPGHVVIMIGAALGAVTTIVLRHVAPRERRVSLVGLQVLYSAIFNGLLMIPTFVIPTPEQLAIFAGIGLLGGLGGLMLIAATKRTPANLVAPVQYSQLIWAILFGALFFGEYPDWISIVGMVVVVGAGLLNVLSERRPIRWKPRLFFFRAGQ
ncbi:Permease of the drug/metabolite transporter (DMT) superfamily [Devosia lucknowensis]|uniref:Permease of the drug/metabolite transporter (DMT) superfamily n=1 Tax=Devosia lucknowensis TaxID=1096929 RepID=A0A1Y6F1Q4_9HYPH|nr:DMT family transporter [Devosia lucknowensis]SMQ66413.1 Permease of the drug/metabolite transporter (DMT) superfamily [Devosia lucknowensis]